MNDATLTRCRKRLIEVARNGHRSTITYSELASHLGLANQAVGDYLDAIYSEEINAGHPDLTLVAVSKGTGFGRYNSRGAEPKSIAIDPNNQADIDEYEKELALVYTHWTATQS